MSKVKVTEIKNESKEIDMEYPIYLYFQDEYCNDELIKVEECYQIKVRYDISSLIIERTKDYFIHPQFIKNNLTTKKHFLEVYNEALKLIEEGL